MNELFCSGVIPNLDMNNFWVDPYKTYPCKPWIEPSDITPTIPYVPSVPRRRPNPMEYAYIPAPLSSQDVDVNIIVDGEELDKIYGKSNVWFVSPHPSESRPYLIRIKNKSSRRITVEVTVDGISVMNGQTGTSGGGYIVNGNSSLDIKGWRRGMDAVAQFVFTNDNTSYAGLTRRPRDIGTITVTAFAEYEKPKVTFRPAVLNSVKRGYGTTTMDWSCCATSCKTGTGYGAEVQDSVVSVDFEKDLMSKIVLVYKYDHQASLAQSGVIPFCPPPEETVTSICPTSRW